MSYQILRSVCEAPLDMPAKDLDLPQWLFQLSDNEYQKCSKGHLAAGASILADGTQTSVNVEAVGGHLMIQHYIPKISMADHLKLVSQSDCWIFHVWYVRLKITWELKLIPTSETTCLFQNVVVVEHNWLIMKVLMALGFGSMFLKKHNAEETPHFAQSLIEATKRRAKNGS
jgi:hypothetical protein